MDADPSWRLIDVLAAVPEQDRALDCSEHVFVGTTELRPSMTLSDIKVEDGSKMTLVRTPVHTAEELEHVVRTICSRALAEPDNIETHADLIISLRTRYPEFPPAHEDERTSTFTRILLTICQAEFESLPESLDPTQKEKQQAEALALMKFIGNHFVRQMLAMKVLAQVVYDLIGVRTSHGVRSAPITDHKIECACVLLKVVGCYLDSRPIGKELMTRISHRLMDLETVFSETITSLIQGVIDMRGRNWQVKA